MTLRLGGDGAITGCTSLGEPTLSISGFTVTTPIEAISGTAAAPSYTFSGDTDNGLYYAGTNSIGVSTSGTNAIVVDASQQVGIGTTSPSTLLHLSSTGEPKLRIQDADLTNRYCEISQAGGGTTFRSRADTTNGQFLFIGNGGGTDSEFLRINSSGNVGIGETSPAHELHVAGAVIPEIVVEDTTNNCKGYLGSSDTNGRVGTLSNHDFAFRTNNVERMRILSSGNVVIGSTTGLTDAQLTISAEDNTALAFKRSDSTKHESAIQITAGDMLFLNGANSSTVSGLTERARITSDGDFLFDTAVEPDGTTAWGAGFINTTNQRAMLKTATNSTTSNTLVAFYNPNGAVGTIKTNGSATSYNTSSDYRLKENVVDIADGITRIKQLQPKRFNFIADVDTIVDGFLAHEAQAVVPEAVTGTHNEVDDDGNPVYQGIDQSKLVPLLTAALQEAIAKIETLESKVAAFDS